MNVETNVREIDGKIVLFKGCSRYDVSRVFIDDVARALQDLGQKVDVIDMLGNDHKQTLEEALKEPIACFFAFNQLRMEHTLQGQSQIQLQMQPLLFNACIDDPFVVLSHFDSLSQRAIITSVDHSSLPALHQWRQQHQLTEWMCDYLPHGGSLLDESFSSEERPYNVMFAGSYTDPDVLRARWGNFTEEEIELLEELTELAVLKREKPFRSICEDFLREKTELVKLMARERLIHVAEMYLRNLLRKEVIARLGDAGIVIDLYGVGWEVHPHAFQHRLCGPLSYRELMRCMRQTKIVLNINPTFTKGSHERPLTAMLQKAVVVTDQNAFYNEHFCEKEHLYTYSLDDLQNLPSIIKTLLNHPQECRIIGENAYREALRAHTWKSRGEEIIRILKEYNERKI